MAHFPFTHADIMALARAIQAGLIKNPAVYPAPPVDLADFQAAIDAYNDANAKFVKVNALKEMATKERQRAFAVIKDKMRKQLRYAENTVGYDDNRLNLLGWAAKRKGKPLATPGQVMLLKAVEQGDDWVALKWKTPVEGGKVEAYEIQRDNDDGKWLHVGMALVCKAKLTDQPQLVDIRYRVVAANKAGEGPASNTVKVVL